MRPVSVVGIGSIPVQKENSLSLKEMGVAASRLALEDAGIEMLDAIFASNMLGSELQNQKHIAAMIADGLGQVGVEAIQVDATSASGAAALRTAYLAVAAGAVDFALAVGVEKMGGTDTATPVLARGLDQETEKGETMVSMNARVMQMYLDANRNRVPIERLLEGFAHFAVNAHANGAKNESALLRKPLSLENALASKMIHAPLRLADCSPICDGAAAVILASSEMARAFTDTPVQLLASSCSTDRFSVASRKDPLSLSASRHSAEKAFRQSGLSPRSIDFFEIHDAFSIMAVLALEACGFAEQGNGWEAGINGSIYPDGNLPLATFGGLKSRGHPVGATALYQACEIVRQLTGQAGANQVKASTGMMQSIGGAGTTILTHIFGL
ncbi:MAG: thiolase domain-containing protein [Spirochaetia bacterium]|nr:thiolase domain-containing protein [Spirochaetia bacterium]